MAIEIAKAERVCVVSKGYSKGNINALTYGDGKIRTYESVHNMDWRVDATVTAFSKADLVKALKSNGTDTPIVTTVAAAMELFGWGISEFDWD